jgi:hypothetical protein
MNDNLNNIFPKDAEETQDFLKKLDEKVYSRNRPAFTDMRTRLALKQNKDFSAMNLSKTKSPGKNFKIDLKPVNKTFSLLTLSFLVISIIVFIGSLAYAFFSLTKGGLVLRQDKIDILLDLPNFTNSGASINGEVTIKNSNRVEFIDSTLSIDIVDKKDGSRQNITQIDIGNVSSGQSVSKNMTLSLNGREGDIKNIETTLFYRLVASEPIVKKSISQEVKIAKSPVILNLTGPKSISIGQLSEYRVSIRGGDEVIPSVAIKLDLPKDMKIVDSSVSPSAKDYFNIGDLKKGEEKVLTFKTEYKEGKELIDNFSIKVQVGVSGDQSIKDILAEESMFLTLSATPFKISASMDDQTGQVQYFSGKNPKLKIIVTNVSNAPIKNGVLNIKFAGGLLNPKAVTVGGAQYDAGVSSARATQETNKKLKEMLPGEKVEFEINYQDLKQTNVSSTRRLLVETVFSADVPDSINSPATSRLSLNLLPKDNTNVSLKTLYFSGAFKNTGPMPPRIGQKTSYTVVANIDTLGGFDKGVMTIILPEYVQYIESSESTAVYKKDKREVIWTIGSMQKSSGDILSINKKEMSFKVSITPSPDQFRLSPNLTKGTRFEAIGIDKNIISLEVPDVTINFSQDPKYESSKSYADVAE